MKKLSALALALVLVLSLAACGTSDNTPTAPSTSTGTSDVANAPTDTPTANIGDGTGIYEGETDASGKFTGWGVWVYHNFRYEGYFVDGVPNGEGTLYEAVEGEEKSPGESAVAPEMVVYGQWVNGKGNGEMTLTDVFDDYTNVWEIEVKDGRAAESGRIEGICSGPGVDTQPVWLPVGEGRPIALVPPWERVGLNGLPAPEGNGTAPTVDSPSQSTDTSSSTPLTATDAADISELVFDAQAVSISAQLNGDGTVTYTYKDTSIKPSYISDSEVSYGIAISGTAADSLAVTTSTFGISSEEQDDGTYLLDLTGFTLRNSMEDDPFSVVIDNSGLSITCTTRAFEDGGLDNLVAFLIQPTLSVGGEIVFREQLKIEL